MRKSVIPGDPDYDPQAWRFRVYLNGVELFNCHTVDEEAGICWCYEHGEVSESCRALKTVERRGIVKLEAIRNDYYR